LKTILECYILHVHGSPIEEVDFSHRLLDITYLDELERRVRRFMGMIKS
jgi:hypothetical protein